jgi:phosphatidate cytidylyltransferase
VTKLQTRLISAFVLVPPVLAATWFGGVVFALFLAVVFGLSVWEWRQMAVRTSRPVMFTTAGIFYFLVSFLSFYFLREIENIGLVLTVILFFCIWSSDSFAYLFGKMLKGPKLIPLVSPKKTVAGLIGAMFGSALILGLGQFITSLSFGLPTTIGEYAILIVVGSVLGAVSQAGDLLISLMKRYVSVKDTGNIIPGHGGILDRIDSLLLTAPIFYLIIILFYNG